MQFRIVRNVLADSVAGHVHPALRAFIPPIRERTTPCTLLLFRFQKDEKGSGMVLSEAVLQALSRLGDGQGERVLAFAGNFSTEAKNHLREGGVEIVVASDFEWVEESIKTIGER